MKPWRAGNSAFPRWLLSLEPYLEKTYATNRLYRWSHERRLRLPRHKQFALHLFGTCAFPRWTSIFAVLGTIAVVVAMFFVSWALLCCPIVVFPFILWPLARQRMAHRLLTVTKFPLWIDDIFSADGIHLQAATDLWLAGCHGGEIVQAIYADARERTWRFWFAGALIMNLIFLTVFFVNIRLTWMERGLLAAAFAFTLWQALKAVQAIGIWRTFGRSVTMRFAHWRGEITFMTQLSRGISDALVAGGYLILMTMMVIYGVGFFSSLFPMASFPEGSLALRPGAVTAALAIIVVGAILGFVSRLMADAVAHAMESYLREAHVRFTEFMVTRVLEDTKEPPRTPPIFTKSVSP